jgi:hypothetical protein
MKRPIRVALSFATFGYNQLNGFTLLLLVCLKNNALFPNLPVSIADLTALLTTFQDKMTAAAQGGPKDTAALEEARNALVFAIRQIAAYVQSLGLENASDVMSSGFDIVVPNTTPSVVTAPALVGLDNSVSTQMQVRLQAVANAKAYQVQFCVAGGAWQDGGIFPNSRGMALTSLMPGTIYTIRVRAIGGVNRYSDWSPTMSLMAT